MGFFFEYGKQVIQLPVVPAEVKINKAGNNSGQEIVSIGEVNILKDVKLAEISFASFFPQEGNAPYVSTKANFQGPQFYMDFFEKLRQDKKPVRFIATELGVNMLVAVEDIEYQHKAGAVGDVNFSISLKQHRSYSIKEATLEITAPAPRQRAREDEGDSIVIGCNVLVNGRLHRDSWGRGPGKTLHDYKGKINFIKTDGRSHPYHVTTPSGGWLGWVVPGAVKRI